MLIEKTNNLNTCDQGGREHIVIMASSRNPVQFIWGASGLGQDLREVRLLAKNNSWRGLNSFLFVNLLLIDRENRQKLQITRGDYRGIFLISVFLFPRSFVIQKITTLRNNIQWRAQINKDPNWLSHALQISCISSQIYPSFE